MSRGGTIAVREHVRQTAAGDASDVENIEVTMTHFEQALDEVDPDSADTQRWDLAAEAV